VQSAEDTHFSFATHLFGQLPPQSTSVSLPFCTPSPQLGVAQTPPLHTPLAQSVPNVQLPAVPQRWQLVAPPQSTSLSPPFFTTSEQLGTRQMLPTQTLLEQSVGVEQILPSAHFPQVPPPQSVSLSPPFLTPSLHVGERHVSNDVEQTALTQSLAPTQPRPVAHFGQLEPQSTSVSVPFLTVSVQVGAWHTPLLQTPL
jgi:hypothetical protein